MQTVGDVVYEQTHKKFVLALYEGVADFVGNG